MKHAIASILCILSTAACGAEANGPMGDSQPTAGDGRLGGDEPDGQVAADPGTNSDASMAGDASTTGDASTNADTDGGVVADVDTRDDLR